MAEVVQVGGLLHGAGQLVEGRTIQVRMTQGQQQPQAEDDGEAQRRGEDVLLDRVNRVSRVVKAHRPQHGILRHQVAGAVGAAKILLGQ